jgi:fumarate reductase flavoprotein subunit
MSGVATEEAGYDVVVVGAGLAGHVAALTAAEAGVSVCLLEKGSEFGGSSLLSGGGLIFAGSDLQRQAGIEDSAEALRGDLTKTGGGKARPEVVAAYADNQLETYEWLRTAGVQFTLEDQQTPGAVARVHFTGRGVAARHLHDVLVKDERITYLSSAQACRLSRAASGRVDGLQVVINGTGRTVRARGAVVLATGGFARSTELLQAYAPSWVDAVKMSGPHNTGDGIKMAMALGAGLADMPYVAASFGASIARYPDLSLDSSEEPILLYPNYRGAIIVNLDARRFVNEELDYKIIARICAQQRGAAAVQIFDEPILQQSDGRAVPLDFKSAFARGLVKRANSIEELAALVHLDPQALRAAVDRYNDGVAAGADADFARPVRYGENPGGGMIATPPFYGFPTRSGLTTTYAGVTVDGRMRVLDVFGAPIEGLYAAGETVGGFHGAGYYSGTGLGKAAVFGRIAGREASRP